MKIYCNKCKRTIGDVDLLLKVKDKKTGQISYKKDLKGSVVQYNSENGILSLRQRLDGEWGVQCDCGANSLLCEAEKGLVKSTKPDIDTINTIRGIIKEKPTEVKAMATYREVDGFKLKG